jgi:hypothetical protein
VETPGTDHDQIRRQDGLHHPGSRRCVLRLNPDLTNPDPDRCDRGLAAHRRTVVEHRLELHVVHGGRQDLSDDAQHPARRLDRLEKAPRLFGQRRQDQVAEGVTVQLVGCRVPVLEDAGQQVFLLRQGDETVPDVPGRGDSQRLAKPSGAAAVVGHGHDARQGGTVGLAGRPLEPAENDRQPGSATHGDDAPRLRLPSRHRGHVSNRLAHSFGFSE